MTISINLTGATVSKDPELKYFDSGSSVLKINVRAANGEKKAEGDDYAPAEWFTIEIWGKLGITLAELIHKHSKEDPCRLNVIGNFVSRKWTTDTSSGVELLIKNPSSVELVDRKWEDAATEEAPVAKTTTTKKAAPKASTENSSDIPF